MENWKVICPIWMICFLGLTAYRTTAGEYHSPKIDHVFQRPSDWMVSVFRGHSLWMTYKLESHLYKFGLKRTKVKCPVDIVVYDKNGVEVGSIRNGMASYGPQITMEVFGNTKEFWFVSEEDYTVEYIGTGSGKITSVIEETIDGKPAGQINYYDIPVESGQIYRQTINAGHLTEVKPSIIAASDSSVIDWSEELAGDEEAERVALSRSAAVGGSVSGDEGELTKGSTAHIIAWPDSGYGFDGWYDEQGELLSTDESYYFAINHDISIIAKFYQSYEVSETYGVKLENEYAEQIKIYVVDNLSDKTQELMIYLNDLSKEKVPVIVRKYPISGAARSEDSMLELTKESDRYSIQDIHLENYGKLELLDQYGNLIGTVKTKKELIEESCGDHHEYRLLDQAEATDEEEGYRFYVCDVCRTFYTETLPKLKQNGNENTNSDKIPVATHEHIWSDWLTVSPSTVFEAKTQVRHCIACTETVTRIYGGKLKPTIKVNKKKITLKKGKSYKKLKVTGLAAGDYVKSYKSSNKKIFTVSKSGKIKAKKKKGKAKLTITLASGLKKKLTVKVK